MCFSLAAQRRKVARFLYGAVRCMAGVTDGTERQTFRVSIERPFGARRNLTVFISTETGATRPLRKRSDSRGVAC